MPPRSRVARLEQHNEAMASAPYPELSPEHLDGLPLPPPDDAISERQRVRAELWAGYERTVDASEEEYRATCRAAWEQYQAELATAGNAYFGAIGLHLALSRDT